MGDAKKAPRRELLAEEEGLEPPSLTAAVFKTADLPISLFLQAECKVKKFTICVNK